MKVDQISYPKLSKSHNNRPEPDIIIDGHQFKKINTGKYILKTNFKDSCVRIQGKFSLVKNIVLSSEGEIYIVYQCFQETDNFFTSPLESKLLGIVTVPNYEDIVQVAKLAEVEAKCVIFPYKNEHVIVPYTDAVW